MEERGDLEHLLRQCLAGQVETPQPTRGDLVQRSVRSARRRRAHQAVTGALAVVTATVLASGVVLPVYDHAPPPRLGVAYVQPEPPATVPTQTLSASPEASATTWDQSLVFDAPVGVVTDGAGGRLVLATGDGEFVSLAHLRDVDAAYRIGDGWVVVAGGERATLWWVTDERRPVLLLGSLDALAVEQTRVAWRRGDVLSAAKLTTAGELEQQVDTEIAEGSADPVGFVDEAVLLARTDQRGQVDWDTWRPAWGEYLPSWSQDLVRVFGAVPDGAVVGLVRESGEPCLALLDADLRVAGGAIACLPDLAELPASGQATVSPDGRWLLVGGTAGRGAGGALVDLAAVFGGAPGAVTLLDSVPAPAGRPVWPDAGTVVYLSGNGVVLLRPERIAAGVDQAAEALVLPGEPVAVFALT